MFSIEEGRKTTGLIQEKRPGEKEKGGKRLGEVPPGGSPWKQLARTAGYHKKKDISGKLRKPRVRGVETRGGINGSKEAGEKGSLKDEGRGRTSSSKKKDDSVVRSQPFSIESRRKKGVWPRRPGCLKTAGRKTQTRQVEQNSSSGQVSLG